MCGIVTSQFHADREYQNILIISQHVYCAIQVGSHCTFRKDAALDGLLEISDFTGLRSPKLYWSRDNPQFVVVILRWCPWHSLKELDIHQAKI